MEPVFTVAKGSEPQVVPQPLHHGPQGKTEQGRRRGCGAGRVVVGLLVFLGITAVYAWDIYRSRHSSLHLAIAIVSYFLFVVLSCCVVKLRLLQLQRNPTAATAAEMRRVRVGSGVVTTALGILTTWRIVDAVHGLALKLVVVAIAIVLHFLGLYIIVLRKRSAERDGNVEKAPETALRGGELSPEEKV